MTAGTHVAGGADAAPGWPMTNTIVSPTTSTVRQPSAPQNQPGSSLRRTPCVVATRAVDWRAARACAAGACAAGAGCDLPDAVALGRSAIAAETSMSGPRQRPFWA